MLFRYLRANFLFWFGCIFTGVGLIVLSASILVVTRTAARKQGFYRATATVIGKYSGDSYHIRFRYTDRRGRQHDGSAGVAKKTYELSAPGQQFPVSVSVVDEADAWLESDGPPTYWIPAAIVFLGLCFFLPGVITGGRQFRRARRAVTAIQQGRYVVGRVEEIVPSHERVNGLLYRVEWSWPGPDGQRRRAQSPSLSAANATHWKRGDEIAAYVHPADPEFAEADVYGIRG